MKDNLHGLVLQSLQCPRPGFTAGMSMDERMLKGARVSHGAISVAAGSFAMMPARTDDIAAWQHHGAEDPTILANRGFSFSISTMPHIALAPGFGSST